MEPAATSDGAVRAIVLAGGTARRLGGVDKLTLAVGGVRLLDRVLAAVAELGWPAVVVGPRRALAAGLPEPTWTRECPVGGGPAAGLAAGLAAGPTVDRRHRGRGPLIAVLAGDLPYLSSAALQTLARAAALEIAAGGAGVLAVDDAGVDQLLLGVWSSAALRSAAAGLGPGVSLRAVLTPLRPARITLDGTPAPWTDCDTADDLAQARALVHPASSPELRSPANSVGGR